MSDLGAPAGRTIGAPVAPAELPGRSGRRLRRRLGMPFAAAALAALVGVGGGVLLAGLHTAAIPEQDVRLMSLSDMPAHDQAPGFALEDQHGRHLSLSSFRGQVVVLEFMDPHCTDICPLVSQEFVDAYRDLGTNGHRVAFLAINVNQYHRSTASMLAFSREHGLTTIPTWHFFTGPLPLLRSAWARYGIYVHAPSPTADVIHSSYIFFIGPGGQERYLASPTDFHRSNGTGYLPPATITEWGHGIAAVARSLLP